MAGAVLRITLSAAALYYVFTKIPFSEVSEVLMNAQPLLLVASILAFITSKILSAYRLNCFFRCAELFLEETYNLKLYLLGMFYNLFLPGGIGGDGYKIYILNKVYGTGVKKLFWAVLADRLSGVLALFILSVLFFSLIPLNVPGIVRFGSLALIPLSAGLWYLGIKKLFAWMRNAVHITNVYSAGVQLLQVLSAWLILRALGETENQGAYMLVFLVSSIASMLPVSIGGAGLREITFLYGAGIFGLNAGVSVALSLLFYLVTAFVSFFGIYYSIRISTFEIAGK